MKKFFAFFLIAVTVFSVTACGGTNNDNTVTLENPASISDVAAAGSSVENEDLQDEENAPQNPVENNESQASSNILVAYFSRVGNTVWEDGVDAVTSASLNVEDGAFVGNAEYLAQMAADATGGDLFLVQTVQTYPSDYRETTDAAAVEQGDNARPELASHVENMDQYDTVVLVYPNWWGTLPMPLYSFLEEYDFSGKTILPLCTHEGSRMGSSERAIAELCPDAVLLDGLDIRGSGASSAQAEVEEWINASGIL